MDEKEVKYRMRQVRESLAIPVQEMAEQVGVSRRSYYALERGDTRILNENFERFSKITGVSPAKLMFGIDPEDGSGSQALKEQIRERDERIRLLEARLSSQDEIIKILQTENKTLSDSMRTKDQVILRLSKQLERQSKD